MRAFTFVLAGALCALASTTASDHGPQTLTLNKRLRPTRSLHAPPSKREPPTDDVQQSIVAQCVTDPVGAAVAAQNIDGVKNNVNGGDLANGGTLIQGDSWSAANPEDNQFPWNKNVPYYPNADATPGDANADGWVALPQLDGFSLDRQVIRDNATIPYYINDHDPAAIKKAVIIFPGKNRDSWKYTNLIRNAFNIALTNFGNLGLTNGSVLIIGPAILNNFDVQYGASQPSDIAWHGSQWQSGRLSKWPTNLQHAISFYEVLDYFTDFVFNTTNFPNLNGLTIAGHSMGGQAVQRYALLKKQKKYDDNIHYLVGNPGSWVWITEDRPFQNSSCLDFDDWQYGIGGNTSKITKYARKDIVANKTEVVNRFRSRNIHYALALLDNGPGDTHCEAVMQGGNHLDRGTNFIQLLGSMPGGFPSGSQTVDFIANVSHQDYAMLATNQSLVRLFKDGYDQRLPDITVSNPGDSNKTKSLPNPSPPPRAFATKGHKMISYTLLGGSVGAVLLIFTILPFMFPSNSDPWEQEKWEQDAKRQLLR